MNRDNDSKVMLSTKECALRIVKVEIYSKYEQGKNLNDAGAPWCWSSDCHVSTLVLGIYVAGAQWC